MYLKLFSDVGCFLLMLNVVFQQYLAVLFKLRGLEKFVTFYLLNKVECYGVFAIINVSLTPK